jgi:hypothetical protein
MLPVLACDLHVAARQPRAVTTGPSHIDPGAGMAPHLSAMEQDWIREQTCLGKSPGEVACLCCFMICYVMLCCARLRYDMLCYDMM